MPRGTRLTIRKTAQKRPWCLDVPAELSDTGKRRRFFYTTEREAKREKERRERLIQNAGIRAARISGSQAAALIKAEAILGEADLVSAATTYRDAAASLAAYDVGIAEAVDFYVACHSPSSSKCFDEAAEEYRRLKAGKRPKYRRDIDRVLSRFGAAIKLVFNEMGEEEPALRALNVDLARSALETLNLSVHDFNLHRRTLNPFFRWAVSNQWMDENPLDRIPNLETPAREIPVLSNTHVGALIECCDEETLPFFALAIFAGIRPQEIKRLSVADFNLKRDYIKVSHTVSKTHRKRFAELSLNLRALLESHPLRDPGITDYKIKKVRRKAVELLREKGLESEAVSLQHWGHSIMRDTFASNHYAFHKDSERLIRCIGHTDLETTANHYLNVVDPDEAMAFWRIGLPNDSAAFQLVV